MCANSHSVIILARTLSRIRQGRDYERLRPSWGSCFLWLRRPGGKSMAVEELGVIYDISSIPRPLATDAAGYAVYMREIMHLNVESKE